jgi:hypothetical protein
VGSFGEIGESERSVGSFTQLLACEANIGKVLVVDQVEDLDENFRW